MIKVFSTRILGMVPDHRLNSLTLYRQYKVRKEIPSKYHCEKSKPPEWWHTETYPWGAFLFIVCINAFGKRKKKVHGWSVIRWRHFSISGSGGPEHAAPEIVWNTGSVRIFTDWWFGTLFIFPYIIIGNNHPSRLSYFSEGWLNHQPYIYICYNIII